MKSKSLFEELNEIELNKDKNHFVENKGNHVIHGAINLIEELSLIYDEDTARDLSNRLINSIKAKDPSKFSRKIKKIIKESYLENK